jgi:hypothetical protein
MYTPIASIFLTKIKMAQLPESAIGAFAAGAQLCAFLSTNCTNCTNFCPQIGRIARIFVHELHEFSVSFHSVGMNRSVEVVATPQHNAFRRNAPNHA